MVYTIEFVKDPGYVSVVFSGDVTIDALKEGRDETNRALASNNCTRVLIEGPQAILKQSLAEEYEFTSGLTGLP